MLVLEGLGMRLIISTSPYFYSNKWLLFSINWQEAVDSVSYTRRISNNLLTQLIVHPPFLAKDTNFILKFICTRKNEIIILLFVHRSFRLRNQVRSLNNLWKKHKHSEMVFQMSRSVSKHVLFCSILQPGSAWDRGSDLRVSQAIPFAVSCATSIRPYSLATQV